jgi:hypothetical protein
MTPQGDVFALGVMLYEILTGVQPFGDEDPRKSMLSVIQRDPQDPRRLSFWVTKSIAAICRKALEKDPVRRYATAADLLADVRAFRSGHPVSVGRRTLPERAVAWYKRNPFRFAVVSSVSLALLLAGVIIGGQFWLDHRLADEALKMVEQLDAEIDLLRGNINRVREARADAPESERAALDMELKQYGTRVLIKNIEAYNRARSVVDLRFIRAESGALRLVRQRFFDTARAALDYGQPEFALALTELAIERYESGLVRDASETDLERIRALASEAESALGISSGPSEDSVPERR